MSKALAEMKAAHITVHNKKEVALYVKAKDPDDACAFAINKIYKDILASKKSTRIKEVAEKTRKVISIKKIRKANPKKGS